MSCVDEIAAAHGASSGELGARDGGDDGEEYTISAFERPENIHDRPTISAFERPEHIHDH